MTTHMIRVLCEPPKGNAESAIENWVTNYTEWEEGPTVHELTETTATIDGSGTVYLRGDWRFVDQGENATDILDNLSTRLNSFQGGLWHRLAYHVCDHDEEQPTPCEWEHTLESGEVPNDVPTIT